MDPTSNLTEQLELAREILRQDDRTDDVIEATERMAVDAARLAELVVALDEWVRRGGHPPEQWGRLVPMTDAEARTAHLALNRHEIDQSDWLKFNDPTTGEEMERCRSLRAKIKAPGVGS